MIEIFVLLGSLNQLHKPYGQLALIMITNELHRRYGTKGIVTISLSPGNFVSDLLSHHYPCKSLSKNEWSILYPVE